MLYAGKRTKAAHVPLETIAPGNNRAMSSRGPERIAPRRATHLSSDIFRSSGRKAAVHNQRVACNPRG